MPSKHTLTTPLSFRDIWPFEHARVRLKTDSQLSDDYVNASHVHPVAQIVVT